MLLNCVINLHFAVIFFICAVLIKSRFYALHQQTPSNKVLKVWIHTIRKNRYNSDLFK